MLCRILRFSTSLFHLLVVIFAWKWCGADPTRLVRALVSSAMTIYRLFFHPPHRAPHPPGPNRHPSARTCATPRPDTRVLDRSHAHANRTRSVCDRTGRHPVTVRRYTGLTVTFSRPAESRFEPRTGLEMGHSRSVPRTAVGHRSRGLAHHPHGAGAGAGCALSRPSWAAYLAQRPRSSALQSHFFPPAGSSAHED